MVTGAGRNGKLTANGSISLSRAYPACSFNDGNRPAFASLDFAFAAKTFIEEICSDRLFSTPIWIASSTESGRFS
jgi:hypothetical protein